MQGDAGNKIQLWFKYKVSMHFTGKFVSFSSRDKGRGETGE